MNILLLGYGKTNKFLKRHFKNDNVVVITDDDYQKLLNSNIVFDFAILFSRGKTRFVNL